MNLKQHISGVSCLKTLSWYSPVEPEETHEKSKNILCPVRDSKQATLEYETEALSTDPTRSLILTQNSA
jgi:hypothetical protein